MGIVNPLDQGNIEHMNTVPRRWRLRSTNNRQHGAALIQKLLEKRNEMKRI